MKKIFYYIPVLFLAGFLITGCADEDELIDERLSAFQVDDTATVAPSYSVGTIDASNYVSVGNSLTAGFMDGALYRAGQLTSMPNLLASSLQQAGGGEFIQPIIDTENGFNNAFSDLEAGIIRGRSILDTSIPGPVSTEGEMASLQAPFTGDKLNNYGVPGLRAVEIASPLLGDPANGNPYYARIAPNPGSSTYVTDVAGAQGTFFTLWLGNNDVLGYAVSGGTGGDGEVNPALDAIGNTLVSNASFQASYDGMLGALTAAGQKGILLNIPPVTVTPFFRAVGYNVIPFSEEDQPTIDQLNASFAAFNAGLDQLVGLSAITAEDAEARKVNYAVGANPVLIVDDNLTDISVFNPLLTGLGQARPATADDLMLLSAGAVINTLANPNDPTSVFGIAVPLPDQFSLTPDEQLLVNTRIAQFNAHIASKASDDIAIFDVNAYFLANVVGNGGFDTDGFKLLPDFSPNGIFSTDGIHPNGRGNALLANQLIEIINDKWAANLPVLDPLAFPGVTVKP